MSGLDDSLFDSSQENRELEKDLCGLRERLGSWKIHKNKTSQEESYCRDVLAKKRKQVQDLEPHIAKHRDQIELFRRNKELLRALDQSFPRPPNFMLRMVLGSISVSMSDSAKVKYKTEYEKYKLKMTLFNLILSVSNILLFNNHWIDILYYFSVIHFYSTIILREHILVVNGSNIHAWWLIHHYLSVVLAGTLILWPVNWPDCEFRLQFLLFSVYTAATQYLQYIYQMDRLYKLRSLSRASPMDIITDFPLLYMRMNLGFLLPFLFVGQLFQLYNGYTLWKIWLDGRNPAWQVMAASILFLLIGAGNFFMTVFVSCKKLHSTG